VVLQVADIPAELHNGIGPLLEGIKIRSGMTCRTWLLEALQQLDSYGYIKLTGSVYDIEMEATDKAGENVMRRAYTVHKSRYSSA